MLIDKHESLWKELFTFPNSNPIKIAKVSFMFACIGEKESANAK